MRQRTFEELLPGLDWIREAPADAGRVELIVRRPAVDERELLPEGRLDEVEGLAGDNWLQRGSSSTPDGSANPLGQVTITSWRSLCLLADSPEERALAGDQIYADLDLSEENLPAGTLLALGSAVLEVTDKPHTGCAKFRERFGGGALRFVNTGAGGELRLRGINARVVQAGVVAVGDDVVVKRSG
ncbi:MAG TPA: MOSC domain-containing protein [Acidimicrobiales bacterium]|nr:MOSC domain-containing protein [Acidimicrobiales bacterium]